MLLSAIQHLDDEEQLDDGKLKSPFGSSFRTFDSSDYSNIGELPGGAYSTSTTYMIDTSLRSGHL